MATDDRRFESRPVPDPTVLTTEQLLREINALRELLEARMRPLATELTGHRRLDDERFSKIEERFQLVERQRLEQKTDTRTAINAALAAQESRTLALDSKIDDLKERASRGESERLGASGQRAEGRAVISSTTAIIGAGIAVIGVVLALLIGRNTATTSTPPPQVVTVTMPAQP